MDDSKFEVGVHASKIQSVTEELKLEVQKGEAKTTNADSSVEETKVDIDDQFNELVESTKECLFVVLVCDPPSDDVLVPVHIEIQPVLPVIHVPDSVMFSRVATLV